MSRLQQSVLAFLKIIQSANFACVETGSLMSTEQVCGGDVTTSLGYWRVFF
jgi:hypothetical protein